MRAEQTEPSHWMPKSTSKRGAGSDGVDAGSASVLTLLAVGGRRGRNRQLHRVEYAGDRKAEGDVRQHPARQRAQRWRLQYQ